LSLDIPERERPRAVSMTNRVPQTTPIIDCTDMQIVRFARRARDAGDDAGASTVHIRA
jgi:hypothetical protein